ncbi:MAG: transcription antitermination factor NusB [Dehalococcoidia bacterium]
MATVRRKARTVVLQALYESDCVGHDLNFTVQRLAGEQSLPEDSTKFAIELASGVMERREEIDTLIHRFAPSFPVNQLSFIDRAILRLAIFEMMFDKRASAGVAINEAVELAKMFGSTNSSRFINGVLGSVSAMMMQK